MIGAAALQRATFEDVEADPNATRQALLVVLLSSLAPALVVLPHGLLAVFGMLVAGIVAWLGWAGVIYWLGTRALPAVGAPRTLESVARTLGFATAPGIVRIFAVVPVVGNLAILVAFLWMLAATVIASLQALHGKDVGLTMLVCVIGFVCYLAVLGILAPVLGVSAVFPPPAL
jgi:hypothetical protein